MANKKLKEMNINVNINESKASRAEMIINTTGVLKGKRIAVIPVDLLDVDYSYQRVRTNHVNELSDEWDDDNCDPLIVSYRNGRFYIIDGQHRYYAALIKGITELVCIIRVGLTAEDEARIFVMMNTSRKQLNPYDIYKANIRNGNEDIPEVKVDMTIKKVCDRHHIEVRKSTDNYMPRILRSLTRAREIVKSKNLGEECLDWMLKLVTTEDKWSECHEAYRSYTMDMLRTFYVENMENIEVETARLKSLMNKLSPTEMLKIANNYAKKYECSTASAMSMVLKELI